MRAPTLKTIAAQLGFIVVAAVTVYGFVQAAKNDQMRAACSATCGFAPAYMGRNRLAPDFELADMNGKPVRLSSFKGKTVVLNFWASWCDPCREEMEALAELGRMARKRKDFVLVTVTIDEELHTAKDMLKVLLGTDDVPFVVLWDPEMTVVKDKYGTSKYPETWIIDPDGFIRARYDGPRDWASAIALETIDAAGQGDGCLVELVDGKTRGPFARLCETD